MHSILKALCARYGRYRRYENILAELSRLSDRELSDIGLSRFNLTAVAREAVYGA